MSSHESRLSLGLVAALLVASLPVTAAPMPGEQLGTIATTCSLVVMPGAPTCADTIALTAIVTPSSATGWVTFDDGSALGAASLVSGTAVLRVPGLATGMHVVEASYLGSSTHEGSTSAAVEVGVAQRVTTTTLTVSPTGTALCGDPVTLTATVPGGVGSVRFLDGAVDLGLVSLDASGVAVRSLATLATGSHALLARYLGDGCRLASEDTEPLQIALRPTPVTLAVLGPSPSPCGVDVVLEAQIPAGVPGKVLFRDGPTMLGEAFVDAAGRAQLTMVAPSAGHHVLTATYEGGGCQAFGVSAPLGHDVGAAATSTALNVTPGVCSAQLAAAVSPNAATGLVEFRESGVVLGTAAVNAGTATFLRATAGGVHLFTARYLGNACLASSVSHEVVCETESLVTAISLQVAPAPGTCADSLTLSAQLLPSIAGATIQFRRDGSPIGARPTDGSGRATLVLAPPLLAGAHTFQASFEEVWNFPCATPAQSSVAHQTDGVVTSLEMSVQPLSSSRCAVMVSVVVMPPAAPAVIRLTSHGQVRALFAYPNATSTFAQLQPGDSVLVGEYLGTGCYLASADTVHYADAFTIGLTVEDPIACGAPFVLHASTTPPVAFTTMEFRRDGALIGATSTDAQGLAALQTSVSGFGPYAFTATMGTLSCHTPTQSPPVTPGVVRGASLVSVQATPNPAAAGQPVRLTASTVPTAATGTVEFFEGATSLGTIALVPGAHLDVLLPEGAHLVHAAYSGDACSLPSTSYDVQVAVGNAPVISIDDAARGEGDAGTADLVFRVRLSHPVAQPVLCGFATQDGDAMAPDDYVATSGTFTVPPGVTFHALSVPVRGDEDVEGHQHFQIVLSAPSAGVFADSVGVGTILDDDPTPSAGVEEGSRGPRLRLLPNPTRGPASIEFTASGGAVRIGVVDVQGREVAVVVDGERSAGLHRVAWEAPRAWARGLYFLRCVQAGRATVRRFVVTR